MAMNTCTTLCMLIRQVLGKHQGAVLRHLLEHLIKLELCMQGQQMQNICDSIRDISHSTQANEHVLPVMDMDIKR